MRPKENFVWIDIIYDRLLALMPSEWLSVGDLYEEIKMIIPDHYAMREANRQKRKINVEQACWGYFVHTLTRLGVDRIAVNGIGQGRAHAWTYQDKIRLKPVPTYLCERCGGGVVRRRKSQNKSDEAKFHCQICDNQHHPDKVVINNKLEPRINPHSNVRIVGNGLASPLIPIKAKDRRSAARALKKLIPGAQGSSINDLVRKLAKSRDNVTEVLRMYGVTQNGELLYLFQRKAQHDKLFGVRGPGGP